MWDNHIPKIGLTLPTLESTTGMATMYLSDVSSKFGAPMGRSNHDDVPADEVKNLGKFELQQVRLDTGGYDKGGAYWGWGREALFRARAFVDYTGRDGSAGGMVDIFFRAKDRQAAKQHVSARYPGARFYR